jgi:hypothetical protein
VKVTTSVGAGSPWAGGINKAEGGSLNNKVQDNLKFKAIGWVQTPDYVKGKTVNLLASWTEAEKKKKHLIKPI